MTKASDFRRYTFVGEFGSETMSYQEYLNNGEIMKLMHDPGRKIVHAGLTVLNYDRSWLTSHPSHRDMVRVLEHQVEENPLMFFLPSGQGGLDFLNDTQSDCKMFITLNRAGKTCHSVNDILLDIVEASPEWPIFKHHGVKYRPYHMNHLGKPHECGFASSNWTVVERVLWPEIRKWIPKYLLGEYDPRAGSKTVSARNPSATLTNGATLYFFCYEQDQGPFESQALDRFFWDEQGEEAKFDGGDERLRTRNGRHVFALTPHKVEGRPDTGARSWIHRMVTGANTKGRNVKVYSIGIHDIPDWIYPERAKAQAIEKWETIPLREKNDKVLREGRARLYGEWHDASGLVYDEWNREVHVVDDFHIPDDWTRYRAIDHGINNPTACMWVAVSPEGDLYTYRDYYRSGLVIAENCRNIIKASGNEVQSKGIQEHKASGVFFEKVNERTVKERYRKTILDPRSFATKDPNTQATIGNLYAAYGLRCQPASGADKERSIPIVKQFLMVDHNRVHPVHGTQGSPRWFVFRSCQDTIREIEGYAMQSHKSSKTADQSNLKEVPVNKNDHLMDTMRYMAQIPPRYIEDRWAFNDNFDEERDEILKEKKARKIAFVDPITGY